MARLPLTRREKEIWQACEGLWAESQDVRKITGDAIREKLQALGFKKGSPNEVYRYRKTWQIEAGLPSPSPTEGNPSINEPPSVLPDPIQRAASMLREEIFLEAKQEIERITETFAQEKAVDQKAFDELQSELNNTVHQLKEAMAQILVLEQRNAQQEQFREELEAALGTQQRHLSELTQAKSLLSEKLEHAQEKYEVLSTNLEQQVHLIKALAEEHQTQRLKEMQIQHDQQVAQFKAEQSYLKDLLESQRHHWVAMLDVEKTEKERWRQRNEVLMNEQACFKAVLKEKEVQIQLLETWEQKQDQQEERVNNLLEVLNKFEKNLGQRLDIARVSVSTQMDGLANLLQELLLMQERHQKMLTEITVSTETS